MPETTAFHPNGDATPMEWLANVQAHLSGTERARKRMLRDRNQAMREAQAAGASLRELSQASGLSKAQVQRICDLSKDRSE